MPRNAVIMTEREYRVAVSRYRRELRAEVLSALRKRQRSVSDETASLLPDESIPPGNAQSSFLFRFCVRLNAEEICEDYLRFLEGEDLPAEKFDLIDRVVIAAGADDVGEAISAIANKLQSELKAGGAESCQRYIDDTLRGLMMGLNILDEVEFERWSRPPMIYDVEIVPDQPTNEAI